MILNVAGLELDLSSGVDGTDTTIDAMRAVVDDALESSAVRLVASQLKDVSDLWSFLRSRVLFQEDPAGVELVRLPEMMLNEIAARGMVAGDCDDRSTLGVTLAKAAGWRVCFVVMTPGERDPEFRHVLFAVEEAGRWVPVDTQETGRLGVWPPTARMKAYPV